MLIESCKIDKIKKYIKSNNVLTLFKITKDVQLKILNNKNKKLKATILFIEVVGKTKIRPKIGKDCCITLNHGKKKNETIFK